MLRVDETTFHPQPQDAFDELARIVVAEPLHGVGDDRRRAGLCQVPSGLPVLVTDGQPTTVVFTGQLAALRHQAQLAAAMDEWQHQDGDGPCLAAATSEPVLLVDDAPNEAPWPHYAAAARRHRVCSSLSVHATVAAALNIYSTPYRAFSEQDVELSQPIAGYARVALAKMHLYQAQTRGREPQGRIEVAGGHRADQGEL